MLPVKIKSNSAASIIFLKAFKFFFENKMLIIRMGTVERKEITVFRTVKNA